VARDCSETTEATLFDPPPDRAPMGFAGLHETYMDATGGELDTACIITTSANTLTREVHDRMPVIVPQEAFSAWLDNEVTAPADALDMLRPAPDDILELTPISKSVGNFANDTEAVQAPVGPALRAAPA
jgi:putative SOS response-associated peptidase YedK